MKTNIRSILAHLFLICIILVIAYPLLFSILNSFKTLKEAYNSIESLLPEQFTLENYSRLFDSLPLMKITFNTFIIATVVTLLKLVSSFLAAYSFVFFNIAGKRWIYFLMISTLFIPFTVTMIPNYLIISRLGLMDNILGVMIPQVADATGIFILTQSMRNIPKALIEVAYLDNIQTHRIMQSIVFPLTRHAISSTGIWFFITTWNEFVWPTLILKSTENFTLPLAMQTFISSEGGTNFTVAMAVSVITMAVPLILYLIFQKYIIGTFVTSGIK